MEKNYWLWLSIMLLFVSFASSFMNNTSVIMIIIPVVIDIAARIGVSASKLLMPLAFAGIMGGINTLISTSTNLLVGFFNFFFFVFFVPLIVFLLSGLYEVGKGH